VCTLPFYLYFLITSIDEIDDEEEEKEKTHFPVIALSDYNAEEPGYLSFSKGQKFYITRQHDDGWSEGWLLGKRGFLPSNCVKEEIDGFRKIVSEK